MTNNPRRILVEIWDFEVTQDSSLAYGPVPPDKAVELCITKGFIEAACKGKVRVISNEVMPKGLKGAIFDL